MAPSSGHLLVPKVLRIAKFAISQTKAFLQSKLPSSTNASSTAILQPIRIQSGRNPNHPLSILQQSRSQQRWFSTTIRNFSSKPPTGTRGPSYRSSLPVSKVSKFIVRRGSAPFASTLRPNLTGGALPRSAGGYSLGAGRGVRHFSHSPSVQAHVVQNVSAGIRAFLVNGGKARFDGFNERNGEKRFKTISATENEIYQSAKKPFNAFVKGTSLEFQLSPSITALSSAASNASSTLDIQGINASKLLDNLSIDFARALKDLSAILTDLRRLSALGDLPLSLTHGPSGPVLTLRFPGCDSAIVSRLCDEANVSRGTIREDEAWDHDRDVEMALLFPFAPGGYFGMREDLNDNLGQDSPVRPAPEQLDWRQMMTPLGPSASLSEEDDDITNLHLSSSPHPPQHMTLSNSKSKNLSGYESLGNDSDFAPEDPYLRSPARPQTVRSEDYEGLEGIYRFLKECDDFRA